MREAQLAKLNPVKMKATYVALIVAVTAGPAVLVVTVWGM
jgi:hypothetical protein